MFPRILSRAHRSVLYSRRFLPIRRTMASQVDKTAVPFDKTALEGVLKTYYLLFLDAWLFLYGSLSVYSVPAVAMPSREIFPASKFGQFTSCRPLEVRRHPARGHLAHGTPPPRQLAIADRPNWRYTCPWARKKSSRPV